MSVQIEIPLRATGRSLSIYIIHSTMLCLRRLAVVEELGAVYQVSVSSAI